MPSPFPSLLRLVARFLACAASLVHLSAGAEEALDTEQPEVQLPDRSLFAKGRYVYELNCVVCHGERGDGKGEMADQLMPKPRNFRLAQFKYRSTPWGKLPTTDDLMRTIREGRTGTAMGMFSNLREDEVRAVAEYLKSFSRKWRKPENHAHPVDLPEPPDWFSAPDERARRIDSGRQTFQSTCASCHGADGDGNGPAAAALVNELGEPTPPADLRKPHLRSGTELRDVYRVLSTGLNGTPMVSFAEALSEERRWELVAFIASLRVGHPGGQ